MARQFVNEEIIQKTKNVLSALNDLMEDDRMAASFSVEDYKNIRSARWEFQEYVENFEDKNK